LNNSVQVDQPAVSDLISSPLGLAAHVEDPDDIIDHLVEDLKESLLAEYDEWMEMKSDA
jgi:hypothetical protein